MRFPCLDPKKTGSYDELISSLNKILDPETEYEEFKYYLFDHNLLNHSDIDFLFKIISYYVTNLDSNKFGALINNILNFKVISDIVNLAMNLGVKCRWFNYVDSNPSGGEPFLEPINCEEFLNTKISRVSKNYIYNLTRKNRESLVFKSCQSNKAMVIFSSDSNFKFSQPLPVGYSTKSILYTAPHHGSNNNANAYAKLNAITDHNSFCIRSHGSSKVGKCHINAVAKKYCTLCNTMIGSMPKTVELKLDNNNVWKLISSNSKCRETA